MHTIVTPALAAPKLPPFISTLMNTAPQRLAALRQALTGSSSRSSVAQREASLSQAGIVIPVTNNFGIELTPVSTPFSDHAGIDDHQPSRKVIVTAHNPSGQPNNFELIEADGTHRAFSNLSGLTGEIRFATARDDGQGKSLGGFRTGEILTGTGAPGQLARIAPDGSSVQNPWVTLPGEFGLLDGGLYLDRTGVFAGDLIAITTTGGVWRINSSGTATQVQNLATRLSGVVTIPLDADKYGPWAGKILVGAKEQGLVYAIDEQGIAVSYNLGVNPEDIRLIPAHENFYGIDAGDRKIWGAPAAAFTGMIGDLLIAQGAPGVLTRVHWNGTQFEASQIASVAQWKQFTFSPAGINQIPAANQDYEQIAVVRHAPSLSSGRVEGALWQLTGENVSLSGTAVITSDLLLPGMPVVQLSGNPTYGGTLQGTQSTQPTGYAVSLSGNASLRHVITRTDPIQLAPVAAPPAPAGTRDVSLSQAGQLVGNFATLRNLSLSGKADAATVPPGTYGSFTASAHTAFVLGVQNSSQPSVYNLESLSLSGGSELRVVGPVVLTVRLAVTLSGSSIGAADNPRQLSLRIAQGNLGLSGTSVLYSLVRAPQGTVSITGTSRIRGTVTADRLSISGNGVLQLTESDIPLPPVNRFPSVNAGPDQTVTLPSDTVSLSGTASDDGLPQGSTLGVTWSKVSGPGSVAFGNINVAATTATFNAPGAYVLRLKASDSLLTSSDDVTVNVVPRNQSPVVDAGPDQTIELPNAATLSGTVSDDALPHDSRTSVLWSVTSGPGTVAFADATSPATTATFSAPGAYTLSLSANDTELSASDAIVVTVYPENQQPTVNAGADQNIKLPGGATLNGLIADDGQPAGGTLTSLWTQVSGPGTVAFSNAASPATSAAFSVAGTYVLRLTASDTRLTNSDDVMITVEAANLPPVVGAGVDQEITLPAEANLNGTATDDGLPTGTLATSWSVVSGPGAVTFADATSRATTASFSAAGIYVLRFEASDSLLSTGDELSVVVHAPINQSPAVQAGAEQHIYMGANLLLNPGGEESPVNGHVPGWNEISGAWAQSPAGSNGFPVSLMGQTYFYPGEAAEAELRQDVDVSAFAASIAAGAQQFEFKAYVAARAESPADVCRIVLEYRDAANQMALATFDSGPLSAATWTQVADTRHAPAGTGWIRVRLLGARQSGATTDAYFDALSLRATGIAATRLNGMATDDGLPTGTLNIDWSKVSGPGVVVFSDAGHPLSAVTFSQPGTYVLRLKANDTALEAGDEVAITVAANQAPQVSAGQPQTVSAQETTVTLHGQVTDDGLPAGASLTTHWSVVSGPGAVVFNDAASPSTTATFGQPGTYVLRLFATDSDQTGAAEVSITITAVNQAPTVDAGADQTLQLPSNALNLSGSVTDDGLPAGNSLTINWSKESGPGDVAFGNAGAAATSATFNAPGLYVLHLRASDSALETSDTVSVNVLAQLHPPQAYFTVPGAARQVPAAIHSFSSYFNADNPPSYLIDDSPFSSWKSGQGQISNQQVTLALSDDTKQFIDRVRMQRGNSVALNAVVKDFEIRVSNASADEADFTTVFAGTMQNTADTQEFVFPGGAVRARYVRLFAKNNYGNSSFIQLSTFHVIGVGSSDNIISLLGQTNTARNQSPAQTANGASVVSYSSAQTLPNDMLDYRSGGWTTNSLTGEWAIIQLAGGRVYTLDAVKLAVYPDNPFNAIKDFEVWASTTTTDAAAFTKVLSGTVLFNESVQTFAFMGGPIQAKYLKLVPLSRYGDFQTIHVNLFDVVVAGASRGIAASSQYGRIQHGISVDGLFDGDQETKWYSQPNTVTNQWIKVLLAGGLVHKTYGVRIDAENGNFAQYGPKDFEIRVSTTTADDSAFTTVYAGTLTTAFGPQEIRFNGFVDAKYVQFFWKNGYSPSFIALSELEVLGIPEEGAALVAFSSQSSDEKLETPDRALDIDSANGRWVSASGQTTNQWLKLMMPGAEMWTIDHAVLQPGWAFLPGNTIDKTTGAKDFEIQVSTTDERDEAFTTVFAGTLRNEAELQHFSFPPAEARYVRLLLKNNQGSASYTGLQTFWLYSPQKGSLAASFVDASTDADGRITTYSWDFGDGQSSAERDPHHTFAAPGTYTVRLTVKDDSGLSSSHQSIYRATAPLRADFSYTPLVALENGSYVHFYDQSSYLIGANVIRRWDTGSGITFTAPTAHTYHAYNDNGTYRVTMKIGDERSLNYSVTREVQVLNLPPSVDIEAGKTLLWGDTWTNRPLAISDPSSVDLVTLRCNWDFGDGQTSEILNCNRSNGVANHIYSRAGVYNATLRVTDKDGGTSVDSATYVVNKHATNLALLETQNAGTGQPVLMRVRLTDDYLKQPLGGKTLRFVVNGTSASAVTSADGVAEATLALAPGQSLTLATATFDEDDFYIGSGALTTGAPAPYARPTGSRDSKGTDFWLMSPANYFGRGQLYLFISAETNTTGTVSAPGTGFSTPFTVPANGVTRITIPTNLLSKISDVVEKNGIHVTAQNPVSVYGLNREQFSTDAFMALPTDALGSEYINLGYKNTYVEYGSEFGIVATADATTVTITPAVKTGARTAGTPFTVTLNQGETYLLKHNDTATGDLSGSRISSSKPVAVFGAHECAFILDFPYCDFVIEQLPPVESWGKRFVTMPLATRQKGDVFRFIASADGTRVYVNGKQAAYLNRGQLHEQLVEGPAYIIADKPVMVMQYATGASFDNIAAANADPFMMMVAPYEQFINRYTVTTDLFGFTVNYINILAPAAAVGQITLDGALIPAASFTPVGNSGFSGAQVAVGVGTHNLSSAIPFGASVYGFATTDAYGYVAGMSLATAGDGRAITLAPKTASNPQNTQDCVTATVMDERNTLLAGERVEFKVTGANSTTATVETNDNGQAQFCYAGANRGDDLIVASVGQSASDTATKTWRSTAVNQTPVVSAGADQGITLPAQAILNGTATDDGLPEGASLTLTWTKTSGPGAVTFTDATSSATASSFSEAGTYALRLTANDSELSAYDEVTITVSPAPVNQPPVASAGPDQHIAIKANLVRNPGNEAPLAGGEITDWTESAGGSWTQATAGSGGFPEALTGVTYFYAGETAQAELRQDVDVSAFVASIAGGAQQFEFKAYARSRDEASPDEARIVVEYRNAANDAVIATLDSGPITSVSGWHLTEDTRTAPAGTGWMRIRLISTRQTGTSNDAYFDAVSLRALSSSATKLGGTATDDALPTGATLTTTWSVVSGPGEVKFGNASAATSSATFDAAGTYVLRLTATDSLLSTSDDVTITVDPANQPPSVNAGADQSATLPDAALLSGTTTDDGYPAGSALQARWSKVSGPGAVTFDDAASAITNATFDAAGTYVLRLTATDSDYTTSDEVVVTVNPEPVNQPPSVNAGADQSVTLPVNTASLAGTATDDALPRGSVLAVSWSQLSGPGTAAFADPHMAATTVTFSEAGTYMLRLTATDSLLSSSDDVTVRVTPPNQAPVVNAGANQEITLPGAANLNGQITDDGLPAGATLAATWSVVSGPGTVTFADATSQATTASFSAAGTYVLRLAASDSELGGEDDVNVQVNPAIAPPTVNIESPADGSELTGRTVFVGTVSEGSAWRLEYRLGGDTEDNSTDGWTTFASGNTPVTNGALGTFDPTMMLNGTYKVRLVATDVAGQVSIITTSATVTGNQKIGNFTVSFKDLGVPVGGLPIEVIRTYDSREKRVGDFGYGWTLALKNVRVEKAGVIGKHWEQTIQGGLIPTYCLRPTRPTTVSVVLGDGKVYKFEARASKLQNAIRDECQAGGPITAPGIWYRAMPGTKGKLESLDQNDVLVFGSPGGPVELRNNGDGELYNPTLFRFTAENGAVYVVDQRTGVKSVADPNGNTLTVNQNGITHSDGKNISFTRDAQGRITQITDPDGKSLVYAYDMNGDLTSFTDREGSTTTYTYTSAHFLLTIHDPLGNQPIFNQYDASGRLTGHTDADGNAVSYVHDLAGRQETITDRLGHVTRYEYDERGNVTRLVDALGGIRTRTYDANNNMLSETNALGKTTTYTYDGQDNMTSVTDALGHVTSFTYDEFGKVLTMTDARGGLTINTYDGGGNLLTSTDPLGHKTTHTYGWRGARTSTTDALGHVTNFGNDLEGKLVNITDAFGNQTSYEYNRNNQRKSQTVKRTTASGTIETIVTTFAYSDGGLPLSMTYADGTKTETIYNAAGQPSVSIDQQGRRTTYDYDEMGRLLKTTYPDQTKEESVYDAEGHRTKSIDRAGRETTYAYDALGRLEKTTSSDSTFTATTYDAVGQVLTATDALGHVTRYEYDAAGRRTKTTDAAGKVTTFTYDDAGNQLTITDAKLQKTTYEYDAANRRTKVIYADASEQKTAYDALGQVISSTDQAGRTTQFEHDKVGRLVKVTDALGQLTTYAYDELGQQVAQTDANNHTTRFEYDRVGRRVKRVLPMGMAEVYAYDTGGRLASKTDFNGKTTTYGYDVMGRLLQKTPDASLNQPAVTFTYTVTGQRHTMTDASGVTTYTYDARSRLTTKATPQGTLTYTYTAADNIETLRSSNTGGVSVNYTYDQLNRLSTVVDNHLAQGTTAYAYDAVGNLESVTLPNGVKSSYSYNTLNRLTELSATKATTAVASYAYTLGAAGNRLSVLEQNGRAVQYSYDALYRLTAETIANDANTTANGQIGYGYDAVGNRLTRTSTLPTIIGQTSTYDANDRLSTDTYDASGNTTVSNGSNYEYDFENRLTDVGDGSVRYVYDGDGNRVAKTVGGVTTRYLVDTNNLTGYAQVVEEITGGNVTRTYTYGHDLISENQLLNNEWAVSFYGYDGHGSVRYLTDTTGAVTDTYTYDAFGNLISRTGSTPNDYLYSGEQLDSATGFYYLRARYMNPSSGRFQTMDSYEGGGTDPLSLHKYTYANNDAANRLDPSGHFSLGELGASLNVHSILNSIATLSLRGALYGALIGGGDAYLRGDDVFAGAVEGGVVGAVLGPIAQIRFVQPVLVALGTAASLVGTVDALEQDNYPLAAFRAVLALSGLVTMVQPETPVLSVPPPEAGSGGRLGNASTRSQLRGIAQILKERGWTITGGGGEQPEEYLPSIGGGRRGSNYPDITATKNGRTLRINTVDTYADGVTPTRREAAAAALIRKKTPGDHLVLIPKED